MQQSSHGNDLSPNGDELSFNKEVNLKSSPNQHALLSHRSPSPKQSIKAESPEKEGGLTERSPGKKMLMRYPGERQSNKVGFRVNPIEPSHDNYSNMGKQ